MDTGVKDLWHIVLLVFCTNPEYETGLNWIGLFTILAKGKEVQKLFEDLIELFVLSDRTKYFYRLLTCKIVGARAVKHWLDFSTSISTIFRYSYFWLSR